ncbi:hypothetical protein GAO09_28285 [Rhizobiales bacterium RZME27]|uniref:Bacterial sugar transferase domain-containing protein n=2 Tax=Endobacterium cereale TaxID=2663029 RepID=A0A6A8AMH2_9HYPH|nr:hypothetical protein [Endobacterium cereale]
MALIALAPLLLAVAVLIKLDSPGPVLFRQTRWGKDCSKIRVYKFRSMRTDLGDSTGVAQTIKNDPRITKLGAILRKTNIDELPQLLNVLKGDMSFALQWAHLALRRVHLALRMAGGIERALAATDFFEWIELSGRLRCCLLRRLLWSWLLAVTALFTAITLTFTSLTFACRRMHQPFDPCLEPFDRTVERVQRGRLAATGWRGS